MICNCTVTSYNIVTKVRQNRRVRLTAQRVEVWLQVTILLVSTQPITCCSGICNVFHITPRWQEGPAGSRRGSQSPLQGNANSQR